MKDLYGQKIISNQNMDFEFQDVLKKHKASKIMVVSGSTYERTYLKNWFDRMPYEFIHFNGFSQNPRYEDICRGTKLFLKEKCDFIIAVGGGSAMDTAKAIKLFAVLDQEKYYLDQELVSSEIPFICVPTTAGSGSEANGNIVFYVNDKKRNLFHKSCIPDYIYYEPKFLMTLPEYVKKSSLADAIAQCIESVWAKNATEESLRYATKGLKLLLDNALQYLRGEYQASKKVQLGAFYSGKAIGIGKTTAAHALSYSLAKTCNIAHGHAVFMLLPAVYSLTAQRNAQEYEQLEKTGELDPASSVVILKERLDHVQSLVHAGASGYEQVKKQLEFIFRILGLNVPPFIGEEEIFKLVGQVNTDRLGNHPISLSSQDIYSIYIDAFRMFYNEDGQLAENLSYTKMVERQKFVKGLQELTLETLLLTQKFLDEHGLAFFLGEGTLLGAVRHHGFIPWDDDVDIVMPRDDYDRLVELAAQGKIPPELNFDALENNDKHWVLGAKMQLVRETDYIQEKVMPLSKCHGPYVDIFPMDYWPKPYGLKLRLSDINVKLCRRMLFMKTGYSKATKKKFHRMVLRIICIFVSNRQIENFAIKNMKKFKDKKRKYLVNLCSYYPFYKEVFPASCFKEAVMVDFEGHPMPIPKDYDYVLKTIYGASYDSIPPYTVTDMRKHAFTLRDGKPVE